MSVHFFHFDERNCGDITPGRRVAVNADDVTCPACRLKACRDHALHSAFLGHVADYCPDCEQPFCPDVDGQTVAEMAG